MDGYPQNPFDLFEEWFKAATATELNNPNAMALATVNKDGQPSVRIVLLKQILAGQFIFFTNMKSQKAREILEIPQVSLCFHWKTLHQQVRVQGIANVVDETVSDRYFDTRSRDSQISAWASQQSHPLEEFITLENSVKMYRKQFANQASIPRPPYWSGFAVKPSQMEFWEERPFRLHQRIVYTLNTHANTWNNYLLYP